MAVEFENFIISWLIVVGLPTATAIGAGLCVFAIAYGIVLTIIGVYCNRETLFKGD